MLFSKEIFAPIVDTDMYADNTRFIDVAYLREPTNDKKHDNTMLRFFVLSCTMGTSNNNTGRIMSSGNFGPNKRAKNSSTTAYNRYFLVADLQNPPHCAAILPVPRTKPRASSLWLTVDPLWEFPSAAPNLILHIKLLVISYLCFSFHDLHSCPSNLTPPTWIAPKQRWRCPAILARPTISSSRKRKLPCIASTSAPNKPVLVFNVIGKKVNLDAPANIPPTTPRPFMNWI
jgi:hypothetical protein